MLNLVANARDAMPDGGVLRISTRNVPAGSDRAPAQLKGTELVEVEVRDNGRGMTRDVLALVLEPFFTTKPAGKGTGLGLSQIHGMIAQMKGAVAIVSAPDRGTAVRLYLPRAQPGAEAAAPADVHPAKAAAPTAGMRVLVVDDDPQVLVLVAEMLRGARPRAGRGHRRTGGAAASGERSDDRPGAQRPRHARHDRRPFAEIMRTRRPDLRIVLMTGYAEEIPQSSAIRAVIRKPFTAETLAQYI